LLSISAIDASQEDKEFDQNLI